jgi:protein-tyrosine-phosphatase
MAPKMRRIMAEMGYSGEEHLAKPYDQTLLDWSDLIVCMSKVHITRINENFSVDTDKIANWEVIDPFFHKGEEVHRSVAHQIKELVFRHFLD